MGEHLDGAAKCLDRFAQTWAKGDGQLLGEQFVEDGSLISPFGERAEGREVIAAMYDEYFGGMLAGTSTTIRVENLRAVGESEAFVDAEQTIVAADGNVVLMIHLVGLLHSEGGEWHFVDARPYVFAPIPS